MEYWALSSPGLNDGSNWGLLLVAHGCHHGSIRTLTGSHTCECLIYQQIRYNLPVCFLRAPRKNGLFAPHSRSSRHHTKEATDTSYNVTGGGGKEGRTISKGAGC